MRLVTDLVPNLAATILAARQRFDEQNQLRTLFPVETTADVRFRLLQRQRVDVLGAVRALSTPSREIRRAGVVEVRGGIPAVSAITRFTESDLQRARILAGLQTDIATLEQDVNTAANDVALAVDNVFELLRGQLLTTGRLSIDNGEVLQEADFGVPDENFVAPAIPWSDPAAPILEDLDAWATQYLDKTGTLPQRIDTTRQVVAWMRRNDQVRASLAANNTATPIVPLDVINNHLQSEGLPVIGTNYQERRIEGQRVFAANRFVWSTGGQMGRTLVGVSEQGVQLAGAGILSAAQTPGLTVATLVEDHPVARFVNADAAGLPVLDRPDELFVATVAPDA